MLAFIMRLTISICSLSVSEKDLLWVVLCSKSLVFPEVDSVVFFFSHSVTIKDSLFVHVLSLQKFLFFIFVSLLSRSPPGIQNAFMHTHYLAQGEAYPSLRRDKLQFLFLSVETATLQETAFSIPVYQNIQSFVKTIQHTSC